MSMGFDYADDFVIFVFNTNSSSGQGQKTTRTLGVDGTMTQWVERDGGGSNYSRTYVEVLLPGYFWWSPNGTYSSEQISSSSWTIDGDFSSNYSMNSSGGMNYSNPSITDMTHTHSGSSSSTLTQNGQTENWEASHDYTTTNSGNTLTTDITESSGTGTSYPDSYEVADPMAWLAGQIVQPFPAFNAGQLMNNLISSLVNRYGHWDNVPQELKDQLSGYFEEGIGWIDGPSQQASQIDALMRAMYEKIHSGDLALAGTPDYAGGIGGDHFNDPYNLLPVEARRPAYHGETMYVLTEDEEEYGSEGGQGGSTLLANFRQKHPVLWNAIQKYQGEITNDNLDALLLSGWRISFTGLVGTSGDPSSFYEIDYDRRIIRVASEKRVPGYLWAIGWDESTTDQERAQALSDALALVSIENDVLALANGDPEALLQFQVALVEAPNRRLSDHAQYDTLTHRLFGAARDALVEDLRQIHIAEHGNDDDFSPSLARFSANAWLTEEGANLARALRGLPPDIKATKAFANGSEYGPIVAEAVITALFTKNALSRSGAYPERVNDPPVQHSNLSTENIRTGGRNRVTIDAFGRTVETAVKHRAGNSQIVLGEQRWHLPKGTSTDRIPRVDAMGDQLQSAAHQAAKRWSPERLSPNEAIRIREARKAGNHWKANLLEQQARGRWIETQLRDQFRQLNWRRVGADAVDPATGIVYERVYGKWSIAVIGV